jgi:hypothetical protein
MNKEVRDARVLDTNVYRTSRFPQRCLIDRACSDMTARASIA